MINLEHDYRKTLARLGWEKDMPFAQTFQVADGTF